MASRLSLGELVGAGPRAVGRYTGTLLAVFIAQTVVAVACMIGVSIVLATVFSHLPLWDEGVDGDLFALIVCIGHAKAHIIASGGIVLGGVLLWQLASWFLVGGIYEVLAQRPDGRAETARAFGAGGAATYLAYARLGLCALPGWALVLWLFKVGFTLASSRIAHALTVAELIGPVLLAALPGLALLHVLWTIHDYARVEMTLRHESHDPSAVLTYLRSIGFVLKRPTSLVHGALGWIGFAIITLGYVYLSQGHPMYGAEGAITLFVIRQGVALARTAIRFGVLAGQVELGKTRALPPRRVEVKSEPKKPG